MLNLDLFEAIVYPLGEACDFYLPVVLAVTAIVGIFHQKRKLALTP